MLVWMVFGIGTAQAQYTLSVFVGGESVAWTADEPAAARDGILSAQDTATVQFEGGSLSLNLADWGGFECAHVLGARLERTADNTYRVSATVRHQDEGWEHYADAFTVTGENVENGVRELLHPHDTEQPFTRSQTGVVATGTVTLSARDTVHGNCGSSLSVNLDRLESDVYDVRFELSD